MMTLKQQKNIGWILKGETMLKAGRSHEKGLISWLQKSSDNQREYLKASIEENFDMPDAILSAIRQIAEARGYEILAKEAGLSQKSLYKILSEDKKTKPRFETISQLIQALGLRFTVETNPDKAKVG
jgi:probable addiction module antidote protein